MGKTVRFTNYRSRGAFAAAKRQARRQGKARRNGRKR